MKKNSQDHFEILRKISKKPKVSQRELAEELGFSLGKLNYCIKELQKKGLIKIRNFKKNKKKSENTYFNVFRILKDAKTLKQASYFLRFFSIASKRAFKFSFSSRAF